MPEESPEEAADAASPIGRRIAVIGNTSSGKTTLGERLAGILAVPFVELDAINWQPNWVSLVEVNLAEFDRRVAEATSGAGWVTAGSYHTHSQRLFWPRLETIIWLDPPLPRLIWRVLTRSWRRWRSGRRSGISICRRWPIRSGHTSASCGSRRWKRWMSLSKGCVRPWAHRRKELDEPILAKVSAGR